MSVFIGGDTQELTFDFSTKVAGSTAECPLRFYRSVASNNLPPTDKYLDKNVGSGWNLHYENDQTVIDLLKSQDNHPVAGGSSSHDNIQEAGRVMKFMVEVDLNPLCNAVYGGSHGALKSAMRTLDVDMFASGSGDNGGSVRYKCISKVWYNGGNQWSPDGWRSSGNNTSENIGKVHLYTDEISKYITTDNKIYILITSGYPSSATIPSTLNLDYINVKLTLARTPDKLMLTDSEGNKKNYLDVNLGDEWSILLKGVSPAWVEKDTENKDRCIFKFYKNNMDRLDIRVGKKYQATGIGVQLGTRYKYQNWKINNFPIEKFSNMNYLLQQKNKKITCYWTDKNGFNKQEIPHNMPNDFYKMFIGNYETPTGQMDSFLERFNFFDYAIANTDQEAEVILRGRNDIDPNNEVLNKLEKQFENPNLVPSFKNSHWIHQSNYSISKDNKTLTIIPTINYHGSVIGIPVLPNNRYKVNCDLNSKDIHIALVEQYNNIRVKNDYRVLDNYSDNFNGEFITSNKTNYIFLKCQNTTQGTFTFSNLELKRLD